MTVSANQHRNFRPEIAGLRAIAVLSVVLYHAGLHQLEGGYVGVDVFFVLSGFLIINIIRRDLGSGKFTFMEFYARRARRLFPAAFALIIVTVLAGLLFLEPQAYTKLSESAIASLGFAANIYFYFNTGYFDAATDQMALIHMWSLGIEEQFYLITPVLLFLASKFGGRKAIMVTLAIIGVLSFVFAMYIVNVDSKFAFFQLPTRAWQFAVGGALAFLPRLNHRLIGNLISFIGLCAVLWGIFTLSSSQLYPSWNALFPTLGSAALIYGTTTSKNITKAILSTAPMVWVGKVSYSTYLWHWPIIVYYRIYILGREFNPLEIVGLTFASFFFGWLSWKYIEERYRYTKIAHTKAVTLGIVFAVVLAMIPLGVIGMKGVPARVNSDASAQTDLVKMWEYDCRDNIQLPGSGPTCVVGERWADTSKKAILWGDSHSEHYGPVVGPAARSAGYSVVVGPRSCPAFMHEDALKYHNAARANFLSICTNKQDQIIEWLQENSDVDTLILTAAWTGYDTVPFLSKRGDAKPDPENQPEIVKEAMERLLVKLRPLDRKIIILGDVPRPNAVLNVCLEANSSSLLRQDSCIYEMNYLSAPNVVALQGPMNEMLADVAARHTNVEFLNAYEGMCGARRCDTFINGEFIYRDSNHIRRNLKIETLEQIGTKIGIEKIFLTQ